MVWDTLQNAREEHFGIAQHLLWGMFMQIMVIKGASKKVSTVVYAMLFVSAVCLIFSLNSISNCFPA